MSKFCKFFTEISASNKIVAGYYRVTFLFANVLAALEGHFFFMNINGRKSFANKTHLTVSRSVMNYCPLYVN